MTDLLDLLRDQLESREEHDMHDSKTDPQQDARQGDDILVGIITKAGTGFATITTPDGRRSVVSDGSIDEKPRDAEGRPFKLRVGDEVRFVRDGEGEVTTALHVQKTGAVVMP